MRDNRVITFCGGRGKGKTDYLKKLAKSSHLPKVLIVDTYDNPRWRDFETYDNPQGKNEIIPVIQMDQLKYWKKGTYRIYSSDIDSLKLAIDKHLFNCLLIWEDATKYFGKSLTKTELRSLYDTKQKNIDAIYVFHSLRKATVEIVENSDILTLKKTGDNKTVVDRKYENPDITALFEEVNKHSDKYFTQSIYIN